MVQGSKPCGRTQIQTYGERALPRYRNGNADCSGHVATVSGRYGRNFTLIKPDDDSPFKDEPEEEPAPARGARITVQFGELPPARRGILDRFGAALDVLRDKPGEWASIAHYPSRAGAWYPRRELEKHLDDFAFDVRSTSSPEGSVLWACFIGES